MPQAALPDLNTKWIMDTVEFNKALAHRKYTETIGYLHSINAMLPKQYRVTISTDKYRELTYHAIIAVCPSCSQEIPRTLIQVHSRASKGMVLILTGLKNEDVWGCPFCKSENLLSRTKVIKPVLEEPHYFQVVPNPPRHTNSLTDISEYHKKIVTWAILYHTELEHQMSLYRIEYKPKDEEVEDNTTGLTDQELT